MKTLEQVSYINRHFLFGGYIQLSDIFLVLGVSGFYFWRIDPHLRHLGTPPRPLTSPSSQAPQRETFSFKSSPPPPHYNHSLHPNKSTTHIREQGVVKQACHKLLPCHYSLHKSRAKFVTCPLPKNSCFCVLLSHVVRKIGYLFLSLYIYKFLYVSFSPSS
ncbi:hypothetical protein QVD17_28213 [Tagetes erecta]|uniref:Uncharacterized protein n=1 Tax=Tagetes erecta TaxID=13708 RepID=A0AAD8NSH9_TARER|nr:hypothetical protein QVD17_28213 [Tagetes erecta]